MIDKVFILGVRRGKELLSSTEVQQMIGRCGRSYTKSGLATVIVPEKDLAVAEEMLFSRLEPITSTMDELENVAFHVIPQIFHKQVKDEASFQNWYGRSLAALQGKSVKWEDVRKYLYDKGCLPWDDACLGVFLSEQGKVSYYFYYTPQRVWTLKNKLLLLAAENLLEDPLAFSWAMATQAISMGDVDKEALANYKSSALDLGLTFDFGETLEGFAFYCILEKRRPKWLKHVIKDLKDDSERLFGAMEYLAKSVFRDNPKVLSAIQTWKVCFKRGIPYTELVLEFPDASNEIIFEINSFSVHNRAELESKRRYIELYCTDKLRKFINDLFGE